MVKDRLWLIVVTTNTGEARSFMCLPWQGRASSHVTELATKAMEPPLTMEWSHTFLGRFVRYR